MYREKGEKIPTIGSHRIFVKPLTLKEIAEIKSAEEAAYKAKTGADFGFKKMRGTADWAKEILMTNPPNKRYGFTPNCQRCIVAHEARMRGYDVIARASCGVSDTFSNSNQWLSAFDYSYSDFKACNGKTGEDVIKSAEKIMHSFGEGARAIILFKWDNQKTSQIGGHSIVAQYRGHGVVNFGDPQTGEIAASYKLKLAALAEQVIILRVDNLAFAQAVKRCCQNKE